jgi:hypothetical protein
MAEPTTWLSRWRAFARHAARIQSLVVLTLLYYLVLVPLALVRRPFATPLGHDPGGWRDRSPAPRTIEAARRQF